jgi:hypothetical protein
VNSVDTLSWGKALAVMIVLAAFVLLAGGVVVAARGWPSKRQSGDSIVRSWLAISLVGALVLCIAPAMFLSDAQLRSTIIGGVVASAGSAVAFYFSSKSSDQARQDILHAAFGMETTPDLVGKTRSEVAGVLATTSLRFIETPASAAGADAKVSSQTPLPGTSLARGSAIEATLA